MRRLAIQNSLKCMGTFQIFINLHWYFILDTGLILRSIELFIYIQTCVIVNAYHIKKKKDFELQYSFPPLFLLKYYCVVIQFNTTQIVITQICVIFSKRTMYLSICSMVKLYIARKWKYSTNVNCHCHCQSKTEENKESRNNVSVNHN
jgi:hypothetical protein